MKYFYDRVSDSLYLTLVDKSAYEDSVEAVPGVVLDFDSRGRLVGLDIENASKTIDVTDLDLQQEPVRADVDEVRLSGAKLKSERERLGLSQSELSRRLDVSANTIARWERGELKMQHAGMLKLALRALAKESGDVKQVGSAVRRSAKTGRLADAKRSASHGARSRRKS